MMIDGVRSNGPVNGASKRRRPGETGWIGPEAAETAQAGIAPLFAAASLEGLLTLQEADGLRGPDQQEIDHGKALLSSLGKLQHRLLAGGTPLHVLRELAATLDDVPTLGADTPLSATVAAISLRVRIELARCC
jgi:hypothetical protein